jgi:hypothetical protein
MLKGEGLHLTRKLLARLAFERTGADARAYTGTQLTSFVPRHNIPTQRRFILA